MKTVRLYGTLARFVKRKKFVVNISSPIEAVRFLLANFPGLDQHMSERSYKIRVGNLEIDEDQLGYPVSEADHISIIPVIAGAGGAGRVLAGVGLIALAAFFPLGAIGLGAAGAISVNTIAFSVGATLALGGVAQLLTPVPKPETGPRSDTDPRESYSFSSIQNVSREGLPVPICYGEILVGSIVISAGIDTTQVKV